MADPPFMFPRHFSGESLEDRVRRRQHEIAAHSQIDPHASGQPEFCEYISPLSGKLYHIPYDQLK